MPDVAHFTIQWSHPRAETGVARAEYHATTILVFESGGYPFLPKAQFWKVLYIEFSFLWGCSSDYSMGDL